MLDSRSKSVARKFGSISGWAVGSFDLIFTEPRLSGLSEYEFRVQP